MRAILRGGDLLARAFLWRDFTTFVRVCFLAVASESGVLRALREPRTVRQLTETLGIARVDLLDALLALGVAVGELSRDAELFRLRGRRAHLLAGGEGDAFGALTEEWLHYDAAVFCELTRMLHGAPARDYLRATATIIARSSRILEPFVGAYLEDLVRRRAPRRVLDVGCGSAVYLRYASAAPGAGGVGIDVDPDVVALARSNLADWGIADRFEIVEGDVRRRAGDLRGPFDLVQLLNNIYYFEPAERIALFALLRSLLADGGALIVVSATEGSTVAIRAFDLVLRSTAGCWALPARDELASQLRESGFSRVRRTELAPGQTLDAFLAT
ncbi:MAG TPA: class I SAM-dependent methyltransferase [Candidatus Limnocylindria bacterium]|nr:class I SAM-dependent methyltransferase [Candidatus Limnocylindria bacterium]